MAFLIDSSSFQLEAECDLLEVEEEVPSQKVKNSLNFSNKLATDKGSVHNPKFSQFEDQLNCLRPRPKRITMYVSSNKLGDDDQEIGHPERKHTLSPETECLAPRKRHIFRKLPTLKESQQLSSRKLLKLLN